MIGGRCVMRDRNGRTVRRVPCVRPGAVGEARDLQVASTAIGTKPFAFPKAVRRAEDRLGQADTSLFNPIEGYLGLGSAPATDAVFRALAENPCAPEDSLHRGLVQGYLTLVKRPAYGGNAR